MIVVDTNVIAYFYITGEHTPLTELLFDRDSQWCAPYLWRSEMRNVLCGYLRSKHLSPQKAVQLMAKAETFLEGREYLVESRMVMELAAQSNCTAYDCEFVALARHLALPLITTDAQITRAFPDIAFSIQSYLKVK